MSMTETVAITGGSGGLGRAIAREFGKRKAQVVLLAPGREGRNGAAAEVNAARGKPLVIAADVVDAEAIEAAAEKAEQEFGLINIWINNAMVTVLARAKEMKPEDYRRATEVTYLGVVYGRLAALKHMLSRKDNLWEAVDAHEDHGAQRKV